MAWQVARTSWPRRWPIRKPLTATGKRSSGRERCGAGKTPPRCAGSDSVRVEHLLVLAELSTRRLDLDRGGPVRIGRRRHASELHEARHEEQSRLRRGQVPTADERGG